MRRNSQSYLVGRNAASQDAAAATVNHAASHRSFIKNIILQDIAEKIRFWTAKNKQDESVVRIRELG